MKSFYLKPGFHYSNPLKVRFGTDFFSSMTQVPGVYFMLGDRNQVLYIGKAKNLKARLKTYSQIKPGTSSDHILEMIEYVRSIRWKECPSEEQALLLESELIRAIRPPYNILGTEPDPYLFIGLKPAEKQKRSKGWDSRVWLDFKLSSCPIEEDEGYTVYGCFSQRKKIKLGYSALLRLFYAITLQHHRFSYPAIITRTSPAWLYTSAVPRLLESSLDEFLMGKNAHLLELILWELLQNENVPAFMRPSLQEDLEVAQEFFLRGPQFTHRIKRELRTKARVLSSQSMDRWMTRHLNLLGAQITKSAS